MTSPPPPSSRPAPDDRPDDAPSDERELVDLLASLALDGVTPDAALLADADRRGVSAIEVDGRRDELAIVRSQLLGPVEPDRTDVERTRRAVHAAMEQLAVDPSVAASGERRSTANVARLHSGSRSRIRHRVAPALVAASVVAIAGFGVLALGSLVDSGDDLASTAAEVSTTARGSDDEESTTDALASDGAVDVTGVDRAPGAAQSSEAVEVAELIDLGGVEDLAAAYAAVDRPLQHVDGAPTERSSPDERVGTCARSLAAELGRSVALISVAGIDHVAMSDGSDVVLVQLVDCTVAPRP